MRYAIYEGNYRLLGRKAKKLTEVNNLSDALNRVAIERNHGREAYIVEIPEGRGKDGEK